MTKEEKTVWTPRVKATHDKPNGNPRFVAGELVMLSRKCVIKKEIPYFLNSDDFINFCKTTKSVTRSSFNVEGYIKAGVPVLLVSNPVEVPIQVRPERSYFGRCSKQFNFFLDRTKKKSYKSYQIHFILDGKVHRMYLTKKEYNQELVRALPIRLEKDYSKQ